MRAADCAPALLEKRDEASGAQCDPVAGDKDTARDRITVPAGDKVLMPAGPKNSGPIFHWSER